jgi:hypothetical protein
MLARLPGGDMVIQAVGAILREDKDIKNIGIDAVAECEVDNSIFPGEGYSRFGPFRSQDCQARAFTPRENNRFDSQVGFPFLSMIC